MSDAEFPPFEEMRRGIQRLMTLAYARQPIVDAYCLILSREHPEFAEMVERLEKECESSLLGVATLIRAHDDRFGWTRAYREFARERGGDPDRCAVCGVLTERGQRKPLGLRDACNRILHAGWIYIDYENITTASERRMREPVEGEEHVLYPTITLKQSPRLSDVPWRADIELFRFIYFANQLSVGDDDFIVI